MPDTSETKEGACACGAIAFRCETNAASAVHCHCNDCRKATGSAFATIAGVPRTAFTLISGKPKSWVTTGDSGGRVERQFCGSCGSPLFTLADHVPDTKRNIDPLIWRARDHQAADGVSTGNDSEHRTTRQ